MDLDRLRCRESNPLKLHGKPIVIGTRMDADGLLENYEDGMSVDQLYYQFRVDKEKIRAVLAFAAAQDHSFAS